MLIAHRVSTAQRVPQQLAGLSLLVVTFNAQEATIVQLQPEILEIVRAQLVLTVQILQR